MLVVGANETLSIFERKVVVVIARQSTGKSKRYRERYLYGIDSSRNAKVERIRCDVGRSWCAINANTTQGGDSENTVWRITGIGESCREIADSTRSRNRDRNNGEARVSRWYVYRYRLIVGMRDAGICEIILHGRSIPKCWRK